MGTEVQRTRNIFAKAGGLEGLKAAIVQTAIKIEGQASANAAVKTGTLRNSIMWSKGWSSDSFGFPRDGGFSPAVGGGQSSKIDAPDGIEAVVGSNVEYAIDQEFGTRNKAAQPYLRPAADAVRGSDASEIANKWGREAMEREFKKRQKKNG
jgi:HK97 gp10 family phage protein